MLGPVIGAAAGFLLGRVTDVPATVRRNDERIRNRNEDSRTWLEDDERALERDVRERTQAAIHAGVTSAGIREQIRDRVTALYEQRYRDQLRDAERVERNILLAEGAPHRAYRAVRRKPYPGLTAADDQTATLERWRERRGDSEVRAA